METPVIPLNIPAATVETWSGKDRSSENFPVGSWLIRRELRPHVHAFYDFARNADDIADSPDLTEPDKITRLGVMEDVLMGRRDAVSGVTASPAATALRRSLAQTGVTPTHAQDLLHAFRQDATQSRTPTWPALLDYCRYSAMPVGRYVLDLHGEAPTTWPASDALCAVLQILNHLQDGARDLAALDRCYLPLDMLTAAGGTVEDLRRPAETPALRQVRLALLDRCDRLNRDAAALPAAVKSRRLRLECAVICGLARRLARRLRAGDPVARRVKLTPADVVIGTFAALRFAR